MTTGRPPVVVVTGPTSGLGRALASALGQTGATVVLLGRGQGVLAEVADEVARGTGRAETVRCDLSSMVAVATAAAAVSRRHLRIDAFVANAGVMGVAGDGTEDGFEPHLAVNHLGHHLLVRRLWPALAAGGGRVITLASRAHWRSRLVWPDPHLRGRERDRWVAYAQSKTAVALQAVEIDRRGRSEGIHGVAFDPGLVRTRLGRHLRTADLRARLRQGPLERPAPVDEAVRDLTWLTLTDEIADLSGAYLQGRAVLEVAADDQTQVAPWAADLQEAERLWQWADDQVAGWLG